MNRKSPALNFASIIARLVVPATVPLQLFGRGRLRTYADLNLWVAKVHQYLIKVAQIEPLPAARTCREMIGLAFGDAIRIEACSAAVTADHSSAGSSTNPWLSTTFPLCVIGT